MDTVGIIIVTALATAVANGIIQTAVVFFIKRSVKLNDEQIVSLKKSVSSLRDDKFRSLKEHVNKAEQKIDVRLTEATKSRKKIYEEYVKKEDCSKMHEPLVKHIERIEYAVVDLARVEEKVSSTARFIEEVNNRQIALGQDLARMEGKHEVAG